MKYADWKTKRSALLDEIHSLSMERDYYFPCRGTAPYGVIPNGTDRYLYHKLKIMTSEGRLGGVYRFDADEHCLSSINYIVDASLYELGCLQAVIRALDRWKAGEIDDLPPSGDWPQ